MGIAVTKICQNLHDRIHGDSEVWTNARRLQFCILVCELQKAKACERIGLIWWTMAGQMQKKAWHTSFESSLPVSMIRKHRGITWLVTRKLTASVSSTCMYHQTEIFQKKSPDRSFSLNCRNSFLDKKIEKMDLDMNLLFLIRVISVILVGIEHDECSHKKKDITNGPEIHKYSLMWGMLLIMCSYKSLSSWFHGKPHGSVHSPKNMIKHSRNLIFNDKESLIVYFHREQRCTLKFSWPAKEAG